MLHDGGMAANDWACSSSPTFSGAAVDRPVITRDHRAWRRLSRRPPKPALPATGGSSSAAGPSTITERASAPLSAARYARWGRTVRAAMAV